MAVTAGGVDQYRRATGLLRAAGRGKRMDCQHGFHCSYTWAGTRLTCCAGATDQAAGSDCPTKWRVIMMSFSPKIIVASIALGLYMAVNAVCAQDSGAMMPASSSSGMGSMHSGMMHSKMMHKMNGSMHMMPASVTSVDAKTGIVGVDAGGMALTVHFPPKSMANLQVGDKITLHMGFSKP